MFEQKIIQLYNLTPENFKKALSDAVKSVLEEQPNEVSQSKNDEFLTRKEACTRLKISKSTIVEWDKAGITKPYRAGNLIRYKSQEINDVLIAIYK